MAFAICNVCSSETFLRYLVVECYVYMLRTSLPITGLHQLLECGTETKDFTAHSLDFVSLCMLTSSNMRCEAAKCLLSQPQVAPHTYIAMCEHATAVAQVESNTAGNTRVMQVRLGYQTGICSSIDGRTLHGKMRLAASQGMMLA